MKALFNSFERVFTPIQFDSICIADRLNKNLAKWHQFATRDGETNEVFVEYMYIKQLGQNEIIYRLLKTRDGKYKITKRITIDEQILTRQSLFLLFAIQPFSQRE